MTIDTSEFDFERSIEEALIAPLRKPAKVEAEDAIGAPFEIGGYVKRAPTDYDRSRCLDPEMILSFVIATQPEEWEKLEAQIPTGTKDKFLDRVAKEVADRGVVDVLRRGVKMNGSKFALAYFKPSSGLNESEQERYRQNIFSVTRQLRYSTRKEKGADLNELDLALFLNGLPIITAELKNPLRGQKVTHAVKQYQEDRDPREPLFKVGRSVAHFAVDPDLVFMATHLQGKKTRFLPFNRGRNGGSGNPIPRAGRYATAYLWEQLWSRDSILDLVQRFVQLIELEDEDGKKTGEKTVIFPRYHQLEAVRRLVDDARERGSGEHYLVQHSAGSGKSNSIGWLAYRLATLHDKNDEKVFDSVIVMTDRRVLDRQLQGTLRQFEQTPGVLENIDKTSRQLRQALEDGKQIIVTTLQKFPVIQGEIADLSGRRFAVIVDEAHSSQGSAKTAGSMKNVLATSDLAEAEAEDSDDEPDLEDLIVADMQKRGRQPNISMFAFTATPKQKTLEVFGSKQQGGKPPRPFSLYSMRQAIEEGFILDVLKGYTTYATYWKIVKNSELDPDVDRKKAARLLKSFVDLSGPMIDKKTAILVDHLLDKVVPTIGGKGKAMLVTRSRLHAVRFKRAVDAELQRRESKFKALVAFSGSVEDGGISYTEENMNKASEGQTANTFKQDEYRLLIVANKFQTGFDQPLLQTMYVDKKLANVNAVQTLSRLNRTAVGKKETFVLDFANTASDIEKAFQPYFQETILSEETDANLLHDAERAVRGSPLFDPAQLDEFATIWWSGDGNQADVHAALAPTVAAFEDAGEEEQAEFRGNLRRFERLYSFLSLVISFSDSDLEKLYVWALHLLPKLPAPEGELPLEVQKNIEVESLRVERTGERHIALDKRDGELDPMEFGDGKPPTEEELAPLSQIISDLNDHFGIDLTDNDRITAHNLLSQLEANPGLQKAMEVNPKETVRLSFEKLAETLFEDILESNLSFYKQLQNHPEMRERFFARLFDHYVTRYDDKKAA